ncbi:hypothetical protein ATKI12_7810 [Kitasatospora sp. Ki12]
MEQCGTEQCGAEQCGTRSRAERSGGRRGRGLRARGSPPTCVDAGGGADARGRTERGWSGAGQGSASAAGGHTPTVHPGRIDMLMFGLDHWSVKRPDSSSTHGPGARRGRIVVRGNTNLRKRGAGRRGPGRRGPGNAKTVAAHPVVGRGHGCPALRTPSGSGRVSASPGRGWRAVRR